MPWRITGGTQAWGSTGEASAASRSISSRISDSEKPFMLSAVIIGEGPMTSFTRSASEDARTSRAMRLISSGGTAPRLLINSAYSPVTGSDAASRSAMIADDLPGLLDRDTFHARFAMNTKPEFALIVAETLLMLLSRDRAGGQRNTQRHNVSGRRRGRCRNIFKAIAAFGEKTCDLVNEQRTRDAARLGKVWKRDVVGDDDHLHLEAFGARAVRRPARNSAGRRCSS